jgi:hypothetical protein
LNLYAFASNNLTNIWAGIGAEKWAVAPSADPTFSKGRITKAKKMPIGSLGVLYCNETKSLTTPFVVYSEVNVDEVVSSVWPEEWVLPFAIKPLGTPSRQLSLVDAKAKLPSLLEDPTRRFDNLIRIRADFAFQISEIASADWATLIQELAS